MTNVLNTQVVTPQQFATALAASPIFASTIGTAAWTALLAGAGYLLKEQYHDVDQWIGPLSNAVIVVLVLVYVARLITRPRMAK